MASDIGNKIKKQITESQEQTQFLKDFASQQSVELSRVSDLLAQQTKAKDELNRRLKGMTKDDPEYANIKRQAAEAEAAVDRLARSKSRIAESLTALGEEDVLKAQEAVDAARSLQDDIDTAKRNVAVTREEIAAIQSIENKSDEDLHKLKQLEDRLETEQRDLDTALKTQEATPLLQKKADVKSNIEAISNMDSIPAWMRSAAGAAMSDEHESISGQILEDTFGQIKGPVGVIANTVGKILDVAMATRKSIDSWVDEAAAVLANNVGRINAALEGSGKTFQDSMEGMVDALGLNRFVRQTDYISQIANLTSRGITYNVEQRALLETIKDKTISSFTSMEGSLLRLVRLKQTDLTATQFGLEVALRNTLNRVFKDSTYMQDMFNGIQSAITDAVMISGNRDVTEYSSVIQTWMGAMYESGVDSSTVSKIANALNALGSGNVSALASDSDLQRLILLSMDTIGMDYADILQQGLSTSDINDLLTAVVKYLTEIEANTKDNNVLTSSYTQLFGMSMADLQAFKNLAGTMGGLTYVNQGSSLSVVNQELQKLQSTERTLVNEQIANAIDNAKFTFGTSIAKDANSYMTWKISNLMLDVVSQVVNAPIGKAPIIGTIAKGVGLGAEMMIFKSELKGILSTLKAIPSLFTGPNTGLMTLINGAPTYGGNSTSMSATMTTANSNFKSVNTMSMIKSNSAYQTEYAKYSGSEWEKEEEDQDPILAKLTELDKLKVNNEAGNQAWAVFLTGMTNDTLRSFASIFADENAMNDTFSGENNVLKDNLFNYNETDNSKDNKGTTTPATNSTPKAV